MKGKTSRAEDIVCQHIKNQIIAKTIFPGSRIIEEQLAQETGVSRTPVREALVRLNYEGLVTLSPNYGAYVANPTMNEIKAAYETRLLIETEIVRLACGRISEDSLKNMRNCIAEQIELQNTHNMQRYLELNRQFHMEICTAANNVFYEKFLNELYNKCDIYLLFFDRFSMTSPEDSATIRDHSRILAALQYEDKTECIKAVREHIQTTLDQLDVTRVK